MSNKRHYKIKSWYVSYFAITYPVIFTAISFLYLVFINKNNLVFIFVANLFFYLPFIFQIFHQKVTLTNRKIYYYCFFRKKADISWDLYKNLRFVSYKQKLLGKIFGFGNITFVNQDEQALTIYMINDVVQLYQQTIYYSTKYLLEKQPDTILNDDIKHIIDLVEHNKFSIDSLDAIDNIEEDENDSQDGDKIKNEKKSKNNDIVKETNKDSIDTLDSFD